MLQRFWLYFVVVEEIHFEPDEHGPGRETRVQHSTCCSSMTTRTRPPFNCPLTDSIPPPAFAYKSPKHMRRLFRGAQRGSSSHPSISRLSLRQNFSRD